MAPADLVRTERSGRLFLLGLNRPGKHNALDQAMVDEIDAALTEARREPCVLIVHSTTPGIFAAGADIAEMVDRDADAALRGINAGLFDRLEAHRWPSIAVIDGPAYGGGCELTLACDLRIASPNARFAQPELGLGIIAGAGANWRLPQTAGLQTARRMLYTGDVLSAEQALAAGLVDAVHPAESVLEQAISLADRIADPILAGAGADQAGAAQQPPRDHLLRHRRPGGAVRQRGQTAADDLLPGRPRATSPGPGRRANCTAPVDNPADRTAARSARTSPIRCRRSGCGN